VPRCALWGSEGKKADSMILGRSLLHATVRGRSFLVSRRRRSGVCAEDRICSRASLAVRRL